MNRIFVAAFIAFAFACKGGFTSYDVCISKCDDNLKSCFSSITFSTVGSYASSVLTTNYANVSEEIDPHSTFLEAQSIISYPFNSTRGIVVTGSVSAANEIDIYRLGIMSISGITFSAKSLSGTATCDTYVGVEQFNGDANPDPSLTSLGTLTAQDLNFQSASANRVLYVRCTSPAVTNYSFQLRSSELPFGSNYIPVLGTFLCFSNESSCKKNCKIKYTGNGGNKKKENSLNSSGPDLFEDLEF
ncbi:hypothetical protein EHQ12_03630 [Leptospira gomenensis]|uniref:Lipoprotein n=1 Tax=Leptospira gomenensis TaxID=2484974 RepID=A0A5F1YSJ9_9LEPT|nr:hypothetical protein [Leptospira gomenensis]TGK31676.1 hypothetical protein EHQ17_12885 [Leptospira gomenensis]TGK41776.1 hypothetical protein EHQ07_15710 [Leptospira gomenensis]TGK43351.1 hypothetical protein EHQ12_03630 [Leptospira gomenensis]TGK61345.1 hypothetical protein EHQ13_08280 [Leptospira gomenensis]